MCFFDKIYDAAEIDIFEQMHPIDQSSDCLYAHISKGC